MFSVIPVFRACLAGLLLFRLFSWSMKGLILSLICLIIVIVLYFYDSMEKWYHYESAFWLFIFSEATIFGTLIICCLYFDTWCFVNLSSALEIPFLGCFLLLGSRVTVTGFHHLLNWKWSWLLLLLTIMLGVLFIILQIFEMNEIYVNIFDSSFHASSFCTVGLHFSHVVIGIVGLLCILFIGIKELGHYRCSILTWYWHFVDYVWLFVYTFVYVC